jgi:hypothetical protein
MAECVDILDNLNPSCDALSRVGGVKKKVWIGQRTQLDSTNPYTLSNGYIDQINMANDPSSQPYELVAFSGKKAKHTGTVAANIGDNVNTFDTSVALVLFEDTPDERAIMETLFNAEELFAIIEGEDGHLQVFGIDEGLMASGFDYTLGVNLNDSTAHTVTLQGLQKKLPYYFSVNGVKTSGSANAAELAASIAALNAITKA